MLLFFSLFSPAHCSLNKRSLSIYQGREVTIQCCGISSVPMAVTVENGPK